ncbi:hypothetical protein B0H13DRAFT_2302320 [Mycena leptocephala]|nr:hypothetical protein B0H13DRAFT_2302320 [Mycena leptocephala]
MFYIFTLVRKKAYGVVFEDDPDTDQLLLFEDQEAIDTELFVDDTSEVTIATGSAGGSRIITATMQELYHHIDQGLSAAECTCHPRWHDQLNGITYFEIRNDALGVAGFNNDTVAYLKSMGYNATYEDLTGSTSHVVTRAQNGTITAASDPRKAAGRGAAY